jgi:hypothetical protein
MLVVGTSMIPIMQNSFAHKKSDFKKVTAMRAFN